MSRICTKLTPNISQADVEQKIRKCVYSHLSRQNARHVLYQRFCLYGQRNIFESDGQTMEQTNGESTPGQRDEHRNHICNCPSTTTVSASVIPQGESHSSQCATVILDYRKDTASTTDNQLVSHVMRSTRLFRAKGGNTLPSKRPLRQ
jgi:hypothetical protein